MFNRSQNSALLSALNKLEARVDEQQKLLENAGIRNDYGIKADFTAIKQIPPKNIYKKVELLATALGYRFVDTATTTNSEHYEKISEGVYELREAICEKFARAPSAPFIKKRAKTSRKHGKHKSRG